MPVERVTVGKGMTLRSFDMILPPDWQRRARTTLAEFATDWDWRAKMYGRLADLPGNPLAAWLGGSLLSLLVEAEEWARGVLPDWRPSRRFITQTRGAFDTREWFARSILDFLRLGAPREIKEDQPSLIRLVARWNAQGAANTACAVGFLYGQAMLKFEHEPDALRGKAVKAGGRKGHERAKKSPRNPYKADLHAQWRAWANECWARPTHASKGHYSLAATLKSSKHIKQGVQQIARVIRAERPPQPRP